MWMISDFLHLVYTRHTVATKRIYIFVGYYSYCSTIDITDKLAAITYSIGDEFCNYVRENITSSYF